MQYNEIRASPIVLPIFSSSKSSLRSHVIHPIMQLDSPTDSMIPDLHDKLYKTCTMCFSNLESQHPLYRSLCFLLPDLYSLLLQTRVTTTVIKLLAKDGCIYVSTSGAYIGPTSSGLMGFTKKNHL